MDKVREARMEESGFMMTRKICDVKPVEAQEVASGVPCACGVGAHGGGRPQSSACAAVCGPGDGLDVGGGVVGGGGTPGWAIVVVGEVDLDLSR